MDQSSKYWKCIRFCSLIGTMPCLFGCYRYETISGPMASSSDEETAIRGSEIGIASGLSGCET